MQPCSSRLWVGVLFFLAMNRMRWGAAVKQSQFDHLAAWPAKHEASMLVWTRGGNGAKRTCTRNHSTPARDARPWQLLRAAGARPTRAWPRQPLLPPHLRPLGWTLGRFPLP